MNEPTKNGNPLSESGTIVPLPVELFQELTPTEHDELKRCEDEIQRGLETFVSVGMALATIRDRQLYRREFRTFEAYCQERWAMTARRARQLWSAAEVVKTLTEGNNCSGPLPTTESQARPLAALPESEQPSAWAEAVAASDGKVTARHVENVVKARLDRKKGTIVPLQAPKPTIVDVPPSKPLDLREQTKTAIADVRALLDNIGTADSTPAAELNAALQKLQNFQDHLDRKEKRFRQTA